jgi:hypothetical protein|uniref:DUF2905 family protein n=1 Tax=candidate division WOR-3 bacterium TaxID=2052148 RepID=A0A7V3NV37_UNCW3
MKLMGKFLIQVGLLFLFLGLLLVLFENLKFRIPGDIIIKKPNLTIFIPIGTSILLSLLLTLLLNLFIGLRK